ncbi:CU044_5270 family protein [Streptomyces sp. bgisy100]|uniref:CU044_5270 family protein n=1 Tax=Streptomyces sp. bgisy100 TaxID=3413783 RepID=UPI003D7281C9
MSDELSMSHEVPTDDGVPMDDGVPVAEEVPMDEEVPKSNGVPEGHEVSEGHEVPESHAAREGGDRPVRDEPPVDDALDLMRRANPVPADAPRLRDRPLDAGAERRLTALLRDRGSPSGEAGRGAAPLRQRRPRRLLYGLAATVAGVVTAVTMTLSGPGAPVAVAAPAPLVTDGSSAVPLARIADRAQSLARRPGADRRAEPGSHVQEWALAMESGPGARPPVTVPQERYLRWNRDGSGSLLEVATDPRHPGRPVIDGSGVKSRVVDDGHVVRHDTYPAGSLAGNSLYTTPPPRTPDALRAYFDRDERAGVSEAGPAADLLDDVSEFLGDWTPGPRETAAITTLLARSDGLRPAGAVTDRLGRRGQAYATRDDHGTGARQMVVLDPETGRILGREVTVTRDWKEARVEAGDVLSYEAWMY